MAGSLARLFLMFSPLFRGVRRVPWVGGLAHRISHRVLPADELIWVRVRRGIGEGLWLKLHPRTGQDYFEGYVEPALQEILCKHLLPGMVFYDIGANIGFFTLLAARMVGARGKVYTFEADPDVADRLRENVEKNEFRNVIIVRQAVWSSKGSVTFSRADESQSPDLGLGRVTSSAVVGEKSIEVPCTSVDEFVATEVRPDFIKCDVEGAECEVVAGGQRVLTECRPLMVCEVHSDQNASRLAQVFATLNYSLNWFTRSHFIAAPCERDEPHQ